MIIKSRKILKKKTGMVMRVGKAARWVTRDIPMDENASMNNTKLLLVNKIIIMVEGVIKQPWRVKEMASHNKLFCL